MKPKFQIAFGAGWIILGFLNGGRTIEDGFSFLFQIDKSFILSDQTVTQGELWRMHNGFWAIAMIAFGFAILASALWSVLCRRKSNSDASETGHSQRGGAAQPDTAGEPR